jgi:type II secretory pathway pseudopilin PulG
MKFASTGTPAASRLRRDGRESGQAGFTLFEALVSLALILAFAGVLGPSLSQARRIMAHADGRVAAQVLLRSLLDAPFDRTTLPNASREGETGGLRWRIIAAPAAGAVAVAGSSDKANWSAFHLNASVAWADGQSISAETIRLGRPPQ